MTALLDRLSADHVPLSEIVPGPGQGTVSSSSWTERGLLLISRRGSTGMYRLRDEHRGPGAIVWLIRAQPSFATCWFRLWFASAGAVQAGRGARQGGTGTPAEPGRPKERCNRLPNAIDPLERRPHNGGMSATAHVSNPGTHWTVGDPARLATLIRLRAVRMVAPHGFGYLGQALSCAEQVAALFTVMRPGRDRLVCSPGHYVIGVLRRRRRTRPPRRGRRGAYGQDGSPVEAIGTERSPVMDYVCGSLGQGLSAAAGFALSDRLKGKDAAHVRPRQRRRAGGGPGLGGGDVRRATTG